MEEEKRQKLLEQIARQRLKSASLMKQPSAAISESHKEDGGASASQKSDSEHFKMFQQENKLRQLIEEVTLPLMHEINGQKKTIRV